MGTEAGKRSRPSVSFMEGESTMGNLVKVSDRINKIVSHVGAVSFVVLIFACVLQVFCRFILNHSLSWTEELARYALFGCI